MSLKSRIGLWVLKRRIVAAYKKGLKMTPLPKWVGWLSMASSIGAACLTFASILPPKYGVALAAFGTFLSNLSHSLPGTGGKTE